MNQQGWIIEDLSFFHLAIELIIRGPGNRSTFNICGKYLRRENNVI